MPRTVEHIVATHQHARELASRGEKIWPYKANIRTILSEDRTNEAPEHLAQVAVRVAGCLRASLPAKFFDFSHADADLDFIDLVEFMTDVDTNFLSECKTPVDLFNGWMEEIYDWCDANRVWTGP